MHQSPTAPSCSAPQPSAALELALPDSLATDALGAALADFILLDQDGLTIHLIGDLGAGKTTLARALLRRLGITGPIKSPTFTLMEPYVAQLPRRAGINQNVSLYCYHFDFYRFTDPREWFEAGFREHFDAHALCLVEWPERAQGDGHLPAPDLAIELHADSAARRALLRADSRRGQACLAAAASSLLPFLPPASLSSSS